MGGARPVLILSSEGSGERYTRGTVRAIRYGKCWRAAAFTPPPRLLLDMACPLLFSLAVPRILGSLSVALRPHDETGAAVGSVGGPRRSLSSSRRLPGELPSVAELPFVFHARVWQSAYWNITPCIQTSESRTGR